MPVAAEIAAIACSFVAVSFENLNQSPSEKRAQSQPGTLSATARATASSVVCTQILSDGSRKSR